MRPNPRTKKPRKKPAPLGYLVTSPPPALAPARRSALDSGTFDTKTTPTPAILRTRPSGPKRVTDPDFRISRKEAEANKDATRRITYKGQSYPVTLGTNKPTAQDWRDAYDLIKREVDKGRDPRDPDARRPPTRRMDPYSLFVPTASEKRERMAAQERRTHDATGGHPGSPTWK